MAFIPPEYQIQWQTEINLRNRNLIFSQDFYFHSHEHKWKTSVINIQIGKNTPPEGILHFYPLQIRINTLSERKCIMYKTIYKVHVQIHRMHEQINDEQILLESSDHRASCFPRYPQEKLP